MKIKSNKNKILYIFCICFAFILINSTIVLTFSSSYQVGFSQGYIPPPSNNIKSKSFLCSQVGIIGPTYTGPDGCPTPCPTSGNIPQGCPVNPIGKGGGILIGNQSGSTGGTNPTIQQCPQVGIIGPTYTGPDGCPTPCPTSGNIPQGCPSQNTNVSNPNNECSASQIGCYYGSDGRLHPCPSPYSKNFPSDISIGSLNSFCPRHNPAE